MIFREFFVKDESGVMTTMELSTSMGDSSTTRIEDFQGFDDLVVTVLPAHPYQYLPHDFILRSLDQRIIENMRKTYSLGSITFVLNPALKKVYGPKLVACGCAGRYRKPCYPQSDVPVPGHSAGTATITWFQFLRLTTALMGESLEGYPLSITTFSTSGPISRALSVGPITVNSLLEERGLDSEEVTLTDHPFAGKMLDFGTVFLNTKPAEILIFPRESRRRAPFLRRMAAGFVPAHHIFAQGFDTTETYLDRPCNKCLKCVTVCPACLQPFLLSAIADKGSVRDAAELGASACTECGLCSYVCPSNIPLMHNIVKLKKEL